MHPLNQLKYWFEHTIWSLDPGTQPLSKAVPIRLARFSYVITRDLFSGQITLQAMSLVYTTLLSLVPLLAVSFSVLKAFGVHNQMEPLLLNLLAPLEAKGVELTYRILEFVTNVRAGVLGSVGLGLLVYTVISLIQKIEQAFNHIWKVKRNRRLARRFSDYLSVIAIGPVLVFSAIGLTASVMSSRFAQSLLAIEPFGTLVGIAVQLIPYLLIIVAFTFVYAFVPNTKVRLRSALVGAVIGGVLWQSIGWGFAAFVANSTNYTAIYAGFAILVFFMIWLYLSWLILLIGANISFYHQNPQFITRTSHTHEMPLSGRTQVWLALHVMQQIGSSYSAGNLRWTAASLATHAGLPVTAIMPLMRALVADGLAIRVTGESSTYVPARPLEQISLNEIVDLALTIGERAKTMSSEPKIDQIVHNIEDAIATALKGYTLKDLVTQGPAPASGHVTHVQQK